jgi:uncharacterized membrane protein YhhN
VLVGPAAVWAAATPMMSVAAGRKDSRLGVPVAVYATALAGMVASSTMLDERIPRRARRRLQGGAVLFLVSDTLLGAREFLLGDERPLFDAAVMATYTAAQGLIAAGAAEL